PSPCLRSASGYTFVSLDPRRNEWARPETNQEARLAREPQAAPAGNGYFCLIPTRGVNGYGFPLRSWRLCAQLYCAQRRQERKEEDGDKAIGHLGREPMRDGRARSTWFLVVGIICLFGVGVVVWQIAGESKKGHPTNEDQNQSVQPQLTPGIPWF